MENALCLVVRGMPYSSQFYAGKPSILMDEEQSEEFNGTKIIFIA